MLLRGLKIMEDRFHSNRYYINRPTKSQTKKGKYWIYFAAVSMFILLSGIILLVIFLVPAHKQSRYIDNYRLEVEKIMNNIFRTTSVPKKMKPHPLDPTEIGMDPRFDFSDEDIEFSTSQRTSVDLNLTKSLFKTIPVNSTLSLNPSVLESITRLPISKTSAEIKENRKNDRFKW